MARLLVVDDDTDFLSVIKQRLEDEGYEVETCADSDKVAQLLEEKTFHCLLLDYRMPGLDGQDLLHLIRSKHWEIPIVLCSGYLNAHDSSVLLKEGATTTLQKPFEDKVLVKTIKHVIEEKKDVITLIIKGYNLKAAQEMLLRKLIIHALVKTDFNVTRAAELLDMTRQTLSQYIRRLKIKYK